MKYPTHILAFPSAAVHEYISATNFKNGITVVWYSDFLGWAKDHVVFMRRQELESKPDYQQLLPYVTLSKFDKAVGSNDILTYNRRKGGEIRLTDKNSIGFGGHVELAQDARFEDKGNGDHVFDLRATVAANVQRELREELRVVESAKDSAKMAFEVMLAAINERLMDSTSDFRVALLSDETDVGRVHLGLSLAFIVESGSSVLSQSILGQLEMKEGGVLLPAQSSNLLMWAAGWDDVNRDVFFEGKGPDTMGHYPSDLFTMRNKYENWTQLVLAKLNTDSYAVSV